MNKQTKEQGNDGSAGAQYAGQTCTSAERPAPLHQAAPAEAASAAGEASLASIGTSGNQTARGSLVKIRLVRVAYSGLLSVHTQPTEYCPNNPKTAKRHETRNSKELIQTNERSRAFLKHRIADVLTHASVDSRNQQNNTRAHAPFKLGSPRIPSFLFPKGLLLLLPACSKSHPPVTKMSSGTAS